MSELKAADDAMQLSQRIQSQCIVIIFSLLLLHPSILLFTQHYDFYFKCSMYIQ